MEGWHRHGTLPGRAREEWLERWYARAAELRRAYEALSDREKPVVPKVDQLVVETWKVSFLAEFEAMEARAADGTLCPTFAADATTWLRKNVWPHISDREEWSPLVSLHHDEVLLLAERSGNGGVFDLQLVLEGNVPDASDASDSEGEAA